MEHSIDKMIFDDIKICQPKSNGFRFGCDSPILAYFTKAKKKWNMADIGSGSGVIATLISKIYGADVTAIELQKEMYDCLTNTINLSCVADKVTPIHSDIKNLSYNNIFDAVVCNPPYRHAGTGRMNISDLEKNARFTITMNIYDVAKFAKKALKHNGKLFFSYDADMLIEAIIACKENGLEPKRIQFLHQNINKKAKLVFVEAMLGGGSELTIEPPLYQEGEKDITKSYENIFKGIWK